MSPKKKLKFCINHPDVAATETCFECAVPICYNCSLDLFGHAFCSHRCASLYMGANLIRGIAILIGGVFRMAGRIFTSLLAVSPRGIVSILLAMGLIACLFFIRRMDLQIHELREVDSSIQQSGDVATVPLIKSPEIVAPAGGTVHSNVITVTGVAEADRIISITVNGQLREVQLPQDEEFKFENISLKRGENRLEVRAMSSDGHVSVLETILIKYSDLVLSSLAKDFRRGPLNREEVAFTFDGGAEDNAASDILDSLKKNNVKGTFFLTGVFIRRFPDIACRIINEGHEVGNHTWSHPHLTSFATDRKHTTLPGITRDSFMTELLRTEDLFEKTTGAAMKKFWRAPFGEYNREIMHWAAEAGYRHIGWSGGRGWKNNGDTMDWVVDTSSVLYHTADEIVDKVINFGVDQTYGASGTILLMHLGTHRKEQPVHLQLGKMLAGLKQRGFSAVKISEMLR
ncbi:polysaccharide deacetylase family protein [bacterium]|nr:polysaccharide deacetylase family protein [bacterium]